MVKVVDLSRAVGISCNRWTSRCSGQAGVHCDSARARCGSENYLVVIAFCGNQRIDQRPDSRVRSEPNHSMESICSIVPVIIGDVTNSVERRVVCRAEDSS